jgi:N-acetylglucosamine-6-phosphate deacetylase
MEDPLFFDALSGKKIDGVPRQAWLVDDGSTSSYLTGPAFFDPQVNGFASIDFQNQNLRFDELEFAVTEIRKSGCAHILLTLITASAAAFEDQLRRIANYIKNRPIIHDCVLGFHLEGPFISAKPGFSGAHQSRHLREPDWGLFLRWQKASGDRIRMITLAPELRGSISFIRHAAASNVFVCLGHTDATLETLIESFNAGARMVTHLGNGCPIEMDRHDNIVNRLLGIPDLMASIIPDGIHIPPPALSNLVRSLGPARLICSTDCMSAAGAPTGRYRLGNLQVTVGEDRVVRHPTAQGFAGSSLTMLEGFYNCLRFGGISADASWRAWTRLRNILFSKVEAPLLAIPFPTASSAVKPQLGRGQNIRERRVLRTRAR